MTICNNPTEHGPCARAARHGGGGGEEGGCSTRVHGRTTGYLIRRHSRACYTVRYSPSGYSERLLGMYSDMLVAIEGMARLKSSGIVR